MGGALLTVDGPHRFFDRDLCIAIETEREQDRQAERGQHWQSIGAVNHYTRTSPEQFQDNFGAVSEQFQGRLDLAISWKPALWTWEMSRDRKTERQKDRKTERQRAAG